jgi:hypothetical protein
MGVRELDAWCAVTMAQGKRRQSSPERWDGDDAWFEQARRAPG